MLKFQPSFWRRETKMLICIHLWTDLNMQIWHVRNQQKSSPPQRASVIYSPPHTAGTKSHDMMHSGKFCVLITLSLLNKYLVSAIFPEDWEVQKKKETKSKLERNWSFICDDGRFQGISECMQTYMVIKRRQSQ